MNKCRQGRGGGVINDQVEGVDDKRRKEEVERGGEQRLTKMENTKLYCM